MTDELLTSPINRLPRYLDRAILAEILARIPAEGRVQFVDLLADVVPPDRPDAPGLDHAVSLQIGPADSELSALLRKLLER